MATKKNKETKNKPKRIRELEESVKNWCANSAHFEKMARERRIEIDELKKETNDLKSHKARLQYQLDSQREHSENLVQKLREIEARLDEHRMLNTGKYVPVEFSNRGNTSVPA